MALKSFYLVLLESINHKINPFFSRPHSTAKGEMRSGDSGLKAGQERPLTRFTTHLPPRATEEDTPSVRAERTPARRPGSHGLTSQPRPPHTGGWGSARPPSAPVLKKPHPRPLPRTQDTTRGSRAHSPGNQHTTGNPARVVSAPKAGDSLNQATTSQPAPLRQANSSPYGPQAADCHPLEKGPAQAPQTQSPKHTEANSLCRATDTTPGGRGARQRRTRVCCQKRRTRESAI